MWWAGRGHIELVVGAEVVICVRTLDGTYVFIVFKTESNTQCIYSPPVLLQEARKRGGAGPTVNPSLPL